jgi:hypothetical protein
VSDNPQKRNSKNECIKLKKQKEQNGNTTKTFSINLQELNEKYPKGARLGWQRVNHLLCYSNDEISLKTCYIKKKKNGNRSRTKLIEYVN